MVILVRPFCVRKCACSIGHLKMLWCVLLLVDVVVWAPREKPPVDPRGQGLLPRLLYPEHHVLHPWYSPYSPSEFYVCYRISLYIQHLQLDISHAAAICTMTSRLPRLGFFPPLTNANYHFMVLGFLLKTDVVH